jgi:hypothetical protein
MCDLDGEGREAHVIDPNILTSIQRLPIPGTFLFYPWFVLLSEGHPTTL